MLFQENLYNKIASGKYLHSSQNVLFLSTANSAKQFALKNIVFY